MCVCVCVLMCVCVCDCGGKDRREGVLCVNEAKTEGKVSVNV